MTLIVIVSSVRQFVVARRSQQLNIPWLVLPIHHSYTSSSQPFVVVTSTLADCYLEPWEHSWNCTAQSERGLQVLSMLMKVKKRVPELLHLLDQVLIYKILKHYRLAKQEDDGSQEGEGREDGVGGGEENRNC